MRRRAVSIPIVLVLAVALAGCTSSGSTPKEDTPNGAVAQAGVSQKEQAPETTSDGSAAGDEPVARVAEQAGPSVVQVNVRAIQSTPFGRPQEGQGVGSGVIYRSDGYVVTNNHVVQNADEVNLAFADGSEERGEVVGTDPSTDIAVVRVDRSGLPAATFGDNVDLRLGELAVAIGSPSGFQSTVTAGVISGLDRDLPAELAGNDPEAAQSIIDLIQTDAAISPGSSGGALLDGEGRVVGINVAYLPPAQTGAESIGFAIPADTVVSVADQLINSGRVTNPYLGVLNLRSLTPELARQFGLSVDRGVIVAGVERGGPADEAGLHQRDVITALDSEQTEDTGDLLAALRDHRPGDEVTLTVVRGGTGSEEELTVELGETRDR